MKYKDMVNAQLEYRKMLGSARVVVPIRKGVKIHCAVIEDSLTPFGPECEFTYRPFKISLIVNETPTRFGPAIELSAKEQELFNRMGKEVRKWIDGEREDFPKKEEFIDEV